MVAPVRLFGTDVNGRPFNTQVDTVDVSPSGMHAAGLTVEPKKGDLIGVQYQQQRARYRVQWVGEAGTYREGHIGLRASENSRISWGNIFPAGYRDTYSAIAMAESAPGIVHSFAAEDFSAVRRSAPVPSDLPAGLEKAVSDLRRLGAGLAGSFVDAGLSRSLLELVAQLSQLSLWLRQSTDAAAAGKSVDLSTPLARYRTRIMIQNGRELLNDLKASRISPSSEEVPALQHCISQLALLLLDLAAQSAARPDSVVTCHDSSERQ